MMLASIWCKLIDLAWRLTLLSLTFENFVRFLFEKQSRSRSWAWKEIFNREPFDQINFQNFIAWSREVALSKISLIERTNKIESNVRFPKFHLSRKKNHKVDFIKIKIEIPAPLRAKIRLIQLVRARLEKYKGFSAIFGCFVHRNYLHYFPPPFVHYGMEMKAVQPLENGDARPFFRSSLRLHPDALWN